MSNLSYNSYRLADYVTDRFDVVFLFFSLARELCFTGRRFTAQEAKEFGFVRCVSDRHFC